MEGFYTATEKGTETVNVWGLRLEEIFQRDREDERDTTLKEKFCISLRSARLKNPTRAIRNVEKV